MLHLLLNIKVYNGPFVICYLNIDGAGFFEDKFLHKRLGLPSEDLEDLVVITCCCRERRKTYRLAVTAYFLKPFLKLMFTTKEYRKNVMHHLANHDINLSHLNLQLKALPPDKEIIDFAWCERMQKLIWSKVELENALWWLSTLGGAFSALGDYYDHWAEKAGEISLRQLQLSRMLGDDGLAERSRLYASLAIAQKGNLRGAKHIVRSVNKYARSFKDDRLHKMCEGVWAKFRYFSNSDLVIHRGPSQTMYRCLHFHMFESDCPSSVLALILISSKD